MTAQSWKRFAFGATAVALAVLLVEGASLLGIAVLNPRLDEPIRRRASLYAEQQRRMRELVDGQDSLLIALDSVLGWRYRAGYTSPGHTMSPQGLRSRRIYAATPPRGVLRVAAFGDSFTYGNEVEDAGSWPAQLESLYVDVEALNYGVGGYGLDQAYLRFRAEGRELRPHVAVLGFVADDLGRVVNVYRRFRSGSEIPLFKPRFTLDSAGGLVLHPAPVRGAADYEPLIAQPSLVRRFGSNDAWYDRGIYRNPLHDWSATARLVAALWTKVARRTRPGVRLYDGAVFDSTSEAFRIQLRVFEAFARDAREAGIEPLVVFYPDRTSLAQARSGGPAVYAPLLAAARDRGVRCLDGLEALAAGGEDPGSWFMPGGHYSPAGNRAIARWLGQVLRPRTVER